MRPASSSQVRDQMATLRNNNLVNSHACGSTVAGLSHVHMHGPVLCGCCLLYLTVCNG